MPKPASPFTGFPSGKVRLTPIPAPFFTGLLPAIDNLGEMKVTLYSFWYLDQLEGNFRYLKRSDFASDSDLMGGLSADQTQSQAALDDALECLLALDPRMAQVIELHYFGGMTYDEIAVAMGTSAATVHRDLRLARAWLLNEIRKA